MEKNELIPHLFRTEYSKITAVLCKLFGFEHIEIAEDIASDTFLSASEIWGLKGLPENPVAWLYTVAKNKAKNHLKHEAVFRQKVAMQLKYSATETDMPEIDLSAKNIHDSQLQMMFAVCHPAIAAEAQIGLALRILCGFGIEEIAAAFLSNKETITKRLQRAKDKLRAEQIRIEFPGEPEINKRLDTVLRTLYLLYNEGYYSSSHNSSLRKDLCLEAFRLTSLLTENENTNKPFVHALLSLMSFQSSRFDARIDAAGEIVLYDDQDTNLWNKALIAQGEAFLNTASRGQEISKYHLEAGIAYWHTIKDDTEEKWSNILQLYNHLLQLEYSPIAALNRTYALSKARGKEVALTEALKLNLATHHLYQVLLGELYTGIDNPRALSCLKTALELAHSPADKKIILQKMHIIEKQLY
ncbi:RNA polymerase sigma factor [Chitinophaga sp. RAB17]|uniref:RNA polymerase sigma factor n=1 Tax=Chitinophaga sp. RAB17 TaxID=3233049 RepID=UPI003F93F159